MHLPFGRFYRSFHRGLKCAQRGRFDEAASWLKKAVDADPKEPRAHLRYGLVLAEEGRYEEGIESVEKARVLRPEDAVIPMFLGAVHMDLGNHDLSLSALEESLEKAAGNQLARSYLALSRWESGQRDEGIRMLLEEEYVQSSRFEARLLGKVEECLEEIKGSGVPEGIDRPLSPPPRFQWLKAMFLRRAARLAARAARLLEGGKNEKALHLLERAMELAPDDSKIRQARTGALRRRIKECQRKMKTEKEDPDLLFERGYLHFECREFDSAGRYLGKWMEHRKREGVKQSETYRASLAQRMLAVTEMAAQRHGKAIEMLRDLLKREPEDFSLHYLLGVCHVRLKDRRAAARAFERFLDREPSFARLRLKDLAKIVEEEKRGLDSSAGKETMV